MTEREKLSSSNPLKYDPELKGLLEDLVVIDDRRTFRRWKGNFLQRLESFLEQAGIEPATKAYAHFSTVMSSFYKQVLQLAALVDKGALKNGSITVKARNVLNEMNKNISILIAELLKLVPTSSAEETNLGYNKYQLGAVLVRDGFQVYEQMSVSRDSLARLRHDGLEEVADKQFLEQIDAYVKQIQCFCDIMADLALYEVMLKCREFDGEDDVLIFVDPKTGAVGELNRSRCLQAGVLTVVETSANLGTCKYKQTVFGDEKQELVDMIKIKLSL